MYASAKPRLGKMSQKPDAQKGAQKPNDQASFRELQSAKIQNFVKNCQTPNARAKIDP